MRWAKLLQTSMDRKVCAHDREDEQPLMVMTDRCDWNPKLITAKKVKLDIAKRGQPDPVQERTNGLLPGRTN